MSELIAKQFRLTPEQNVALKALADQLGVSQSEVVRRIIETLPEDFGDAMAVEDFRRAVRSVPSRR